MVLDVTLTSPDGVTIVLEEAGTYSISGGSG